MQFDETFRTRLTDLFAWRRDVRRFKPDPLPPGTMDRLLGMARLAPSVGLCEPWRFVLVDDPARRQALLRIFEESNARARDTYADDLARRYAELKLAGIAEAPAQVSVFVDRETMKGNRLGRLTMPEMADYSAVLAIHTIWLGARAEGIGLGWVSILDPARVAEALDVPPHWRLIGHLCLGYPAAEALTPELERAGWEARGLPAACVLRR